MKIGFAGIGIMGLPMATHLLNSGYALTVFNRTPEKYTTLLEQGAQSAPSFSELLATCDIVICVFSNDAVLKHYLDQINQQNLNAQVLVNMSTISPNASLGFQTLCESMGLAYVEAPVVGSKPAAENGQLLILASGNKQAIQRCEAPLSAFSKQIVYCGPSAEACNVKLVLNTLLATMTVALSEALLSMERLQFNSETFLRIMESTPLHSLLFQIKGPLITQRTYPTQFPLEHMHKDLKLALDLFTNNGITPLLSKCVVRIYDEAIGNCNEEPSNRDMSIVAQTIGSMMDKQNV